MCAVWYVGMEFKLLLHLTKMQIPRGFVTVAVLLSLQSILHKVRK